MRADVIPSSDRSVVVRFGREISAGARASVRRPRASRICRDWIRGWRHHGWMRHGCAFPQTGWASAADPVALRLGNPLAGNPEDAAALEMTLAVARAVREALERAGVQVAPLATPL